MGKRILIVLVVLSALLGAAGVVVSLQPDTFTVERSAAMAAPAWIVFEQVNDLRAWDAWSPWKELDPDPKTTISTPSWGKGATLTWSGNEQDRRGPPDNPRQPARRSRRGRGGLREAFEGKALMTFSFAPSAGGTLVTWRMVGTNDFIGKAVCMVMDMDAMLGKDFERGLARMKAVVEKGAATPAAAAR